MGVKDPCCQDKLLRAGLLALLVKRRRLGYVGHDRMKKILLLYTWQLLQRNKRIPSLSSGMKKRRWWVRPIFADHDKHGAWSTLIPTMRETDEDMYFNFLRMTPQAFDRLLVLVQPFTKKISWRAAISPGERLAITLRYLASGDSQMSISYLFRVSSPAISRIVLETTVIIWNVLKRTVFPTMSEDLWLKVAAEFQVMWDIPHRVGAIDGKQVPIKAFPHCGSRYFWLQKRHCLTFMAVSDAKHKFLIVESGASGKRSDGNIFNKSSFARNLGGGKLNLPPACPVPEVKGDMPFFFVGDNAYPKSKNLATPFKGNALRDEEMVHNYRLSRARRIVENAFGILCARFRIMFRPIEGSPSLVRHIILACVVLHNLHLQDEESVPPKSRKYRPHGYADYVRGDGKYIFGRWRNENPANEKLKVQQLKTQVEVARSKCQVDMKGKELAEMLVRYFIFNPVPWQLESAHLV